MTTANGAQSSAPPRQSRARRKGKAPARPTGGCSSLKLNLGCGPSSAEGYVNVDIEALPGVDVVCDLDIAPWPWEDDSISEIVASHLFEHIRQPLLFMAEAWRVLEPGGLLDIRVPGGIYIAPGYWLPHQHSFTDPTHLRHCTPIMWDYWIPGEPLHEAYGYQVGSVKGGPRFELQDRGPVGEQREELRIELRKLGGDD